MAVQAHDLVGASAGLRRAWTTPAATPTSCTQDRAAKSAGENSPMTGSLARARSANGSVLTTKAASATPDIGTAGRIATSKATATSSTGANRSWSFISCGVWLSFTALLGFLRTATCVVNMVESVRLEGR